MNGVEFLSSEGRLPVALGAIRQDRAAQIGIEALLAAARVAGDRATLGAPGWEQDLAVRNWLRLYVETLED